VIVRSILALLAVTLAACGSPAASGSPTPTPVATTATATPSVAPSVIRPTIQPTIVPLPSFAAISAPSANVVWIYVGGRSLFRSTDRGTTWEQRPVPPAPNGDITFVDDHEGWVSLAGSGDQCAGPGITAWHTTDAGVSWEQLAPTGLSDNHCKVNLAFVDAGHGFLDAFAPLSGASLYRTSDGGKSWTTAAPLADPPGYTKQPGYGGLQPGHVAGFAGTALVPVSDPTSGKTFVFRSTDGGGTWQYAGVGPTTAANVAFVTASRWLEIVPGDSVETADGGATWHAYTTTYQQAAPIAPAVVFGDANVGYATVRGALQRTTDGGAHWTAITTPGT
jgi:photosystem II stability/assembly factor-like uncharacterized protein